MKQTRRQHRNRIRRPKPAPGKSGAFNGSGGASAGDHHWEYEALVQAQAELEASRDRYADLYDSAPVGYLTLNRSGCIQEINLTGCRLLGDLREDLVDRPLLVFIARAHRRKYLQHLARCRRQHAEQRVELALARAGGAPPVLVELVSLPTLAPETGHTVFKSVLVDITARKRAEEGQRQAHDELEERVAERTAELTRVNAALLDSEKNLADFFDQSPLGLLWVGGDGCIQRANLAQLDLMGTTPDQCIGRHITEFATDPATITDALQRLARAETLQNFRTCLRRPDGSMRHVLIDANGLWEAGRLGHSRWFVRDTTHRLELEREILAISEREQQRIGQDLHDGVCQQLTGIKFRTRLLEQKLAKRGVGEKRDAHTIETLLNRAIEQARGQARGLNPVRLEADGFTMALQELAAGVSSLFHIRCSCRLPPMRREPDQAVAIHLYRIAQESISNAIKHGRAKRVDIRLTGRGGSLRLSIRDDGMGLPRVPKQTTGMGLHIMNYRARSIGAVLDVRRGDPGGTIVTCSLSGHRSSSASKPN